MTFENGLTVALASDLLNVFFIVGGYKLAKRARIKQDSYIAKEGEVIFGMRGTFVWVMSLLIGLIVAWFFPVKFHEMYCAVTGFSYRIGLLAKATQVVLVVQVLYVFFRAPTVVLPVGRVILMVVLPVCLIFGHYFE